MKGHKRRPRQVSRDEFDKRWDETFTKKQLINSDQSETLPEPDAEKQLKLPFEFWPEG